MAEAGRHSLSPVERPPLIYQILQAGVPAAFPPLRPLQTPPTNLPMVPTSFIGRERERASLGVLLAQTPLLTLVGAGGCGKTRLALQVAADLLERYPEGVWLVELASLRDPLLVARAAATALGVREEHNRPLLETLCQVLAPKRLLLVLDNCEHLLPACAELAAALLARCPHLQILATSRERLAIQGETSSRRAGPSPDTPRRPGLELGAARRAGAHAVAAACRVRGRLAAGRGGGGLRLAPHPRPLSPRTRGE